MSEFDQAISDGHGATGSVASMESNRKQENRADFVRVVLALGLLALIAAFNDARASGSPPSAPVESALSR